MKALITAKGNSSRVGQKNTRSFEYFKNHIAPYVEMDAELEALL